MTEQYILALIKNDAWMLQVLRVARDLHLPDWMIGAGFVRAKVWDVLHGYETRTPLGDVDVIYFDSSDIRESKENELQNELSGTIQGIAWSVTNQARIHIENQESPYISSEDALAHWPETPTAVAVRLKDDDALELIAPYGIRDLVNMEVKISPKFSRSLDIYRARIAKKRWQEKWPKVKIFMSQ